MSRLNQMLHLDRSFFLADHNLNYTDKMAMSCGVEVRVPFLDPDLVAFTERLPDGLKQHGRQGKYLLRAAMRGVIPDAVLNRSKTGFGFPCAAVCRVPMGVASGRSPPAGGWMPRAFSRAPGSSPCSTPMPAVRSMPPTR